MTYYVHRAFMLSGKTHKYVWALVVPVILNIGLNLWLIRIYGLMGAVWATVICYAIAIVIATLLARKDYPLPLPIRPAIEILIACAAMSAAVLALPLDKMTPGFITLMIKAVIGGFVYLLVCWIINAANCRHVIRTMKQKFSSSPVMEPAE